MRYNVYYPGEHTCDIDVSLHYLEEMEKEGNRHNGATAVNLCERETLVMRNGRWVDKATDEMATSHSSAK